MLKRCGGEELDTVFAGMKSSFPEPLIFRDELGVSNRAMAEYHRIYGRFLPDRNPDAADVG
ncbi:MAG: hypothetical protein ABSA92_13035 [Candidatus Bathyarchaeia archaeon]|jgi:hypothetical protein